MNEFSEEQNWFKRNWKWFVPLILILTSLTGLLSSSSVGGKIAEMAKIHMESSICDNALDIAKRDERVIELLGGLQPLGKLAIIEGSHKYSDDYNTIEISITVTGSKLDKTLRSKMDILDIKNKDEWVYKTVNIRIKKPENLKQTIEVIKQPK